MTTATLPAARPAHGPVPAQTPGQKLWTVEQFHYLGDLGVFEGRRAMLIDGEILEEGPMNPPHAIAATKTEDAVRDAFGKGWHVRASKPLVLGLDIDPEPDVAVVPGRPGDYTSHPTTAPLVIEVSDTSLSYDTTQKLGLYAAAGIRDYWVLDINGRQLLVFRDPVTDPAAARGHRYATVQTFGPADSVAPLAVPTATLRVADLLP
jgi:Uma2 family endonuclease